MTPPLKITGINDGSVAVHGNGDYVDVWLDLSRPLTPREAAIAADTGLVPMGAKITLEHTRVDGLQETINELNASLTRFEADAARQLEEEQRAQAERDFKEKATREATLKKLNDLEF